MFGWLFSVRSAGALCRPSGGKSIITEPQAENQAKISCVERAVAPKISSGPFFSQILRKTTASAVTIYANSEQQLCPAAQTTA
ncbi:hypothetical protein DSM3645_13910 [Blastopirellula marina DSM 3645]|uniref:Uncharacterized protein n=1 Tax=Blastopirellula marina DSM 3645 TaxID=314230 RepID=A3ZWU0_9BACT|nr:hypothetical protein DSM3645_13910 [Blastopirellula marina DSM 3645]